MLILFSPLNAAAIDCSNPPPAPQSAGAQCDPTVACFTITTPSGQKVEANLPKKPCEGNYVCRPETTPGPSTAPINHTCQCAFGSFEMPLPFMGGTVDVCEFTGRGGGFSSPFAAFVKILDEYAAYLTAIIVGLGMVMTVFGGYVYMTAGGDGGKISTAKKIIGAALAGIILALLGYLILSTISTQFTEPPDPLAATTSDTMIQ